MQSGACVSARLDFTEATGPRWYCLCRATSAIGHLHLLFRCPQWSSTTCFPLDTKASRRSRGWDPRRCSLRPAGTGRSVIADVERGSPWGSALRPSRSLRGVFRRRDSGHGSARNMSLRLGSHYPISAHSRRLSGGQDAALCQGRSTISTQLGMPPTGY